MLRSASAVRYPAGMADVSLVRVCKRYTAGGPLAVRDLSLRVGDGEFVVLVGPSGCGKTTTLRLVAGLEELTSGEVFIGARNVSRAHPRERNVAMVFQDYALYPHMTAQQNMAFGLKMRRTPRKEIERRVGETAQMLGITDLLQRKPGALSGGQRQRVALGRAIVRLPGAAAFLFDEPLSNLDAAMRTAMRAEIKSLHQRLNMTTLYVTHDQEEAMTLGQRVVVMAGGVVQQEGPPLEVYRRPRNRFVAGFLGSPAMNFIPGRIVQEVPTLAFVENGEAGSRMPLLPSAARDGLTDGMHVTLGVRPEDVGVARGDNAGVAAGSLRATVRLIEFLGDQMNIHAVTAAGTSIVSRIKARETLKPGDAITFGVYPTHIHLFAPGEFGMSLLAP